MNRRASYAAVASGNPASSGSGQTPPARSGAFAHLMNPSPPLTTPYSYTPEGDRRIPIGNHQTHLDNTQDDEIPNGPTLASKMSHPMNYWSETSFTSHGNHEVGKEALVRPSYLRHTRYMEKLEVAHQAKLATQRESATFMEQSSNTGLLSKSSSSVNLGRMAPSHRGMTYDIVENPPVAEEDLLPQLPSQWKEYDKEGLEISSDGLELRCTGTTKTQEQNAAAARADFPIPPQSGLYYFEVTILSKGKDG